MKQKIEILVIILFLVISGSLVFAEIIHLKSGEVIEGDIFTESEDSVKVHSDGFSQTYYKDEIESITGGPKHGLRKQENDSEEGYSDIKENDLVEGKSEGSYPDGGLKDVFKGFLEALKSGDRSEIKKYLSRKASEKNNSLSDEEFQAQGQLMLSMMSMLDLNSANEAIEGDAGYLKWGQEKSSTREGAPVSESFEMSIAFIKEDSAWKVNLASE